MRKQRYSISEIESVLDYCKKHEVSVKSRINDLGLNECRFRADLTFYRGTGKIANRYGVKTVYTMSRPPEGFKPAVRSLSRSKKNQTERKRIRRIPETWDYCSRAPLLQLRPGPSLLPGSQKRSKYIDVSITFSDGVNLTLRKCTLERLTSLVESYYSSLQNESGNVLPRQ